MELLVALPFSIDSLLIKLPKTLKLFFTSENELFFKSVFFIEITFLLLLYVISSILNNSFNGFIGMLSSGILDRYGYSSSGT